MLKAAWRSLLARRTRLLMSTTAVVLGVGFVAGTLVFTDTLSRSFAGIFASTVGDVVVRPAGATGDDGPGTDATVPASLVDDLAEVEGAARADGNVTSFGVYVVGEDGKVVGGQGAPGIGSNHHDAPAGHGLEGLRIAEGRVPDGPGEVALDRHTAEQAGYEIGDQVHLVTSGDQPILRPRLVGLADFAEGGSLNGATMTIFDERVAQRLFLEGRHVFSDVWVTAAEGVGQEQLRDSVSQMLPPGLEAVTGDQAAEDAGGDLMEAISFITTFLLIFAGISLVVGSFLIVNTFSVLVAQRTRELALLRAVGASRGQVNRSVLLEAALLGVIGASVGLAVGLLLAMGIRALMATFGLDLAGQELVFAPRTVVVSLLVGTLVTVLAAALPARRAGRVAPVEAMRDGLLPSDASLRLRFGLGVGLLAGGAAAILVGLLTEAPGAGWWVGGGALATVAGATTACPLLVRPAVAALAPVYVRLFGSTGRLAGQNALRNPRRTAATASALMIGMTLVTTMAVLGASARASVDKAIEEQFAGDLVISNAFGSGFSGKVADRVESVPGVDTVTRFRHAIGSIEGQNQGLVGVEPRTLERVVSLEMREGELADLVDGSVLVSSAWAEERGLEVGDELAVGMPSGLEEYQVVGLYEDNPVLSYPVTTSLGTLRAAGFDESDNYLMVTAEEGVAPTRLQASVERLTSDLPTVTVKDQAGFADEQRGSVDQLLTLVYALLALALVIAVLGIVNTLALSVIERTREVGLLRAVGLSRPQTRRMVRLEAGVIALVGGGLGAVLGLALGVVLAASMRDEGLRVISAPWGQIAAFVVASGVVGVTAAALPARRAARLDILGAIVSE